MIRNKCKDKPRIDHEKLLTSGSHPAVFRVNIKDHKDKENQFFPLRPIASVKNTPTEKVDWLSSVILNQLVKFVPAHLDSTKSLINILEDQRSNLSNDEIFVSLDVKNLYTSIPIKEGLDAIQKFANEYWHEIDTFGFTVDDLLDFLKFIAYNYEISYSKKVYLQI